MPKFIWLPGALALALSMPFAGVGGERRRPR